MDERAVEFDPQQQLEEGREKISEGMKCLQDLVQWCNVITEKGGRPDEIIAYVKSLQPQVEFLQVLLKKPAYVNPRLDYNIFNKEVESLVEITQIRNQNANFEPNLNQDNEIANPSVESSSRTKRRKLKSKVWDDFTKYEGEDGKELAKCNHCEKEFVGSSKSGTTHLKNHLERCKSKSNPGGADKSIETSASLTTPVVIKEKSMVDLELGHLDETRMIIKYWVPSVASRKDDILKVYEDEKEKLFRYFNKLPCRFSVTMEWCGENSDNFWFIALCFIDDSWELKKKIIHLPKYRFDENFYEILKCSLQDWNIDKNICCMIDNRIPFYNGTSEEFSQINNWFSEQGSLPCIGSIFPFSRLLLKLQHNIIWKSTEWKIDIFFKMEKLLEYLKKTSSNEKKFQSAVDKAKSMGKKVASQGIPRLQLWGFELIEWVMGFREAFCQLESTDPDFKSINFVREDWDKATALYASCRVLKDASRSLSNRKYNTANGCFPMMYHIFFKFLHWEKSGDHYFRDIASSLRKDFDEYWRISNLILVITVVLDPRFKMDIVERWYKEIYGNVVDTHLKIVTDAVTNIYNDYAKSANKSKSSCTWGHGEMLNDMWRPCTSSPHVNDVVSIELDSYLRDSKFCPVEEFDILAWWRLNSSTFPTLARMARDFLAIPISAPIEILDSPLVTEIEDIFDCQSLDDDFKRALACTKVWL